MKVLIVEDEAKLLRSLERGLAAEGYIVDVARDSDSASTLAENSEYDLVILDWMIPGHTDGPGLIKEWRSDDSHTQAPILILTARSTIGDRVFGLDNGADDYLTKPFSFDELLARSRALLRRPQDHTGNNLQAGSLHLDVSARTASHRGEELHLTTKEYQLLEYLLHHQGEVVNKDQILDHVWPDDARVQHNTVETFIANVRKKLDGDPNLETVRGYGYKIDAK
jgi:two-component system OmpR family response regulator